MNPNVVERLGGEVEEVKDGLVLGKMKLEGGKREGKRPAEDPPEPEQQTKSLKEEGKDSRLPSFSSPSLTPSSSPPPSTSRSSSFSSTTSSKTSIVTTISLASKSSSKSSKPAVLEVLGLEEGCGARLVQANLLSTKKLGVSADIVASFITFISLRYRMFEARQAGEKAPLVHRILEETHFTNIHRELDTGTRYLRYHLRGRSAQEKVFAIVLYRAVNRVETFEAFRRRGHRAIPSTREAKEFMKFVSNMEGSVFTNAHQALSVEKLRSIVSTLTKGLEGLTREVEEAATMERAYLAIRAIEFLGQFYAFQMVADLVEHGILNFSENSFVVLGGGAERGLKVVEGEVRDDHVTQLKYLAKVVDKGLAVLELPPVRLLNRPLSSKAMEHALCEYMKLDRAARERGCKARRYSPRQLEERGCDECGEVVEGGEVLTCLLCSSTHHPTCLALPLSTYIDHWLCPDCHAIEATKGVHEEEEVVQGQLWEEEKLKKMLRVKRIKVPLSVEEN